MPFCVDCDRWFPRRADSCWSCGGELTGERPAAVTRALAARAIEAQRETDPVYPPNLPDHDEEQLTPIEANRLVHAFEAVRRRAIGRHAAPESWLPAPGTRVATALSTVYGEAEDDHAWPQIRTLREAFVDLQAFIPDEEAAAAEAFLRRPVSGDGAGRAALDRVAWAQADAISLLREDDKVLGAHNALVDVDIVVGEAQRSLEAVDRYKESQAIGIAAMAYWPIGLLVGSVLGTFVAGVSLLGIAIVIGIASAGYVLFLAPLFGTTVGTLTSRIDRRAMRSDRMLVVGVGRLIADLVGYALFFGVPVAIAAITVVLSGRLGPP